ncbi:MAG: helix-turn-helix domain-containing protein [Parasphingorhabdus sp.]|nr:helix-turn-helix domain-containing protein [Parasphingorhabdus sp.]
MNMDQKQPDRAGIDRHHERIIDVASDVRSVLEGNRSDKLLRLFDYLLEKSLCGETPSEQQIADEAFADDSGTDGSQDANVRVYVYRLRKLIDSTFAGKSGPRIEIPVGSYCINLVDRDEPNSLLRVARWASGSSLSLPVRVALLGLAVMTIGGLALVWTSRDTDPLAKTVAWQPFEGNVRPLMIVIGDYYLFARLDANRSNADAAPQLVWDRSVPTREDLTIFQMLNPTKVEDSVDYNQQFVSGGTIEALSNIRATIAKVPAFQGRSLRLTAASQLTPEMLTNSDIIYVGQFSGMPLLLRDPLVQASGFELSKGNDALIDAGNGERYQSDGMILTDERIARRDFAYIAGFSGPANNRILIVAALGDAGLKEAAELAGDPDQLLAIKADAKSTENGFEALYRVRTMKNVNIGATLILDRVLRASGIWDNSENMPVYRPIEAFKLQQANP